MKKGRVMVAVVLGLSLVLTVGIVLASVIPNGCHCYEACYYCDPGTGCKVGDGPGGCFCVNNPCRLSDHLLCCVRTK
jgi:hypothetical protein